MSKFAKAQLEKYGWKEGEGLGKDKTGVTSHVRAARSGKTGDTKGEAFGLGHEKAGGSRPKTLGVDDMGFGAVLKDIGMPKKAARDDSSDDETSNRPKRKAATKERCTPRASPASVGKPVARKPAPKADSSSSGSDSDSGDEDPTGWSDAKLFAKCGGVRLGRGTQREGTYEGKFARAGLHAAQEAGKNPYLARKP